MKVRSPMEDSEVSSVLENWRSTPTKAPKMIEIPNFCKTWNSIEMSYIDRNI